jgi:hypothetical protein
MTYEVYKNRKVSPKLIAIISPDEVASFPADGFAAPRDKTFYKIAGTGQMFYFKDGTKKLLTSFVVKQQRITADFTFSQAESDSWAQGVAVAPRDGTYLKGDKDATVYFVVKGQLRPLTYDAYKARKLTPKKISVAPQAEVDLYAKGEVLTK